MWSQHLRYESESIIVLEDGSEEYHVCGDLAHNGADREIYFRETKYFLFVSTNNFYASSSNKPCVGIYLWKISSDG